MPKWPTTMAGLRGGRLRGDDRLSPRRDLHAGLREFVHCSYRQSIGGYGISGATVRLVKSEKADGCVLRDGFVDIYAFPQLAVHGPLGKL